MSYIYMITNKLNGKAQIGKTDHTIEKRWREHCCDYHKEKVEKRPLYSAMRKYGPESFGVQCLEIVENNRACERERYWIEYYGTFKNGYNATVGGDGKPYIDYNLVLAQWDEGFSVKDISIMLGCSTSTIKMFLNKQNISKDERLQRRYTRSLIYQKDIHTGETVNIFSSIRDAAEHLGLKDWCHISEVCSGKRKSAYGYKWTRILKIESK